MWALLPMILVLGYAIGYAVGGTGATGDSTATTADGHAAPATPHEHATHDMAGMSDADMAGMDMTAPSASASYDMAGMPTAATSSSPAPAAGHGHDMPGMSERDMVGHAATSTGTGTSVTTRANVVATFAAINAAILVAAVLVRRRTRRPATAAA
jgi:hypothetical protein